MSSYNDLVTWGTLFPSRSLRSLQDAVPKKYSWLTSLYFNCVLNGMVCRAIIPQLDLLFINLIKYLISTKSIVNLLFLWHDRP